MFIRAKYVLQFSRGDDHQNILLDPAIENRRLFGPVFLKPREARRKEAFHTTTNFTLLHIANFNSK